MFFGVRINYKILSASRSVFGDEFADAFGRAYGCVRPEWKALMRRLKNRGLPIDAAASVAAAWLASRTNESDAGFPSKRALLHASNKLHNEHVRRAGFRGISQINEVLRQEGLEIDLGDDEDAS